MKKTIFFAIGCIVGFLVAQEPYRLPFFSENPIYAYPSSYIYENNGHLLMRVRTPKGDQFLEWDPLNLEWDLRLIGYDFSFFAELDGYYYGIQKGVLSSQWVRLPIGTGALQVLQDELPGTQLNLYGAVSQNGWIIYKMGSYARAYHPDSHQDLDLSAFGYFEKAQVFGGKVFLITRLGNYKIYEFDMINQTLNEVYSSNFSFKTSPFMGNILIYTYGASLDQQLMVFDINSYAVSPFFNQNSTNIGGVYGSLGNQVFLDSGQLGVATFEGNDVEFLGVNFVQNFTIHNGKAYFTNGQGIYRSDGSLMGTELLSSRLGQILPINSDHLAVRQSQQVWSLDLTSLTEELVLDESLQTMHRVDNGIVLDGIYQSWTTDGTISGTQLVLEKSNDYFLDQFFPVTSLGKDIYLNADGTTWWATQGSFDHAYQLTPNLSNVLNTGHFLIGALNQLYGLEAGARVFSPLNLAPTDRVADWNGDLYLFLNGGLVKNETAGPINLASVNAGRFYPTSHALYYLEDSNNSVRLWQTTGTPATTRVVKTMALPSGMGSLGEINGKWIFYLFQNGSVQIFAMGLADVEPQLLTNQSSSTTENPLVIGNLGNYMYFSLHSNSQGRELWRTDGAGSGTALFYDLTPGPISGLAREPGVVFNDHLYFSGLSQNGYELFRSDGTLANTGLFKDINPGPFGSSIRDFRVLGQTLFFVAYASQSGRELWHSDGSDIGTDVFDLEPGPFSSSPEKLVVSNEALMFRAYSGFDFSLWTMRENPDATIFGPQFYCGTGPLTFEVESPGAGMTFIWNVLNGNLISGQGSSQVQVEPSGGILEIQVQADWLGHSSSGNLLVQPISQVPETPSTIDGPSAVCPGFSYVFSTENDPMVEWYEWLIPNEAHFVQETNGPQAQILFGSQSGTIQVRGHNQCGVSAWQELTVSVSPVALPNAGQDQSGCQDSFALQANDPPTGYMGTWSILSGSGGVLADINDPNSLFSGIAGETYRLGWQFPDLGCGEHIDIVQIHVQLPPQIAEAGADQTVCASQTVLNALPAQSGVGQWTVISGSGGIFSDEYDAHSIFSGEPGETYQLLWSIFDKPCAVSSDTCTVLFQGSDAWVEPQLCGNQGEPVWLQAPTYFQGYWSVQSGPDQDPDQFEDLAAAGTWFTPFAAGEYRLVWVSFSIACGPSQFAFSLSATDEGYWWSYGPLAQPEQNDTITISGPSVVIGNDLYFIEKNESQTLVIKVNGLDQTQEIVAHFAPMDTPTYLRSLANKLVLYFKKGKEINVYLLKTGQLIPLFHSDNVDTLSSPITFQDKNFLGVEKGYRATVWCLSEFETKEVLSNGYAQYGLNFVESEGDLFLEMDKVYHYQDDIFYPISGPGRKFLGKFGDNYFVSNYYLYWSENPLGPYTLVSDQPVSKVLWQGDFAYLHLGNSIWRYLPGHSGLSLIVSGGVTEVSAVLGQVMFYRKNNSYYRYHIPTATNEDLGNIVFAGKSENFCYFWSNGSLVIHGETGEPFVANIFSSSPSVGAFLAQDTYVHIMRNQIYTFVGANAPNISPLQRKLIDNSYNMFWFENELYLWTSNYYNRGLYHYNAVSQALEIQLARDATKWFGLEKGIAFYENNNLYLTNGSETSVSLLASNPYLRWSGNGRILYQLGNQLWMSDGSGNPKTVFSSNNALGDFVSAGPDIYFQEAPARVFRLSKDDQLSLLVNFPSGTSVSAIYSGEDCVFIRTNQEDYYYYGPLGTQTFQPGYQSFDDYFVSENTLYVWSGYANNNHLYRLDRNSWTPVVEVDDSAEDRDLQPVYFQGKTYVALPIKGLGWELTWFENGMLRVADIWPGPQSSLPEQLVSVNGQMVFSAFSQRGGGPYALSEGCIRRLMPSPENSEPGILLSAAGHDFQWAAVVDRGDSGHEVWQIYDINLWLPDPQFKQAVLLQSDLNSDNQVQYSEALTVTDLNVEGLQILWLQGLQHFVHLRNFWAQGNQVYDLTPLAQNEQLGSQSADVIDVRHNHLGQTACPQILTLQQRVNDSGATFLYEPQDAAFGFPNWDAWPLSDITSFISGVLLPPQPLNCQP
ncbi:MAG: hypothetical protein H6510_16745 [Acidobacteria bacterium]|nr:hypothetical protein [Acidobacteriota bacterium]MCB9399464.1 hypothetical protein [Acidobacteriota bacterium]